MLWEVNEKLKSKDQIQDCKNHKKDQRRVKKVLTAAEMLYKEEYIRDRSMVTLRNIKLTCYVHLYFCSMCWCCVTPLGLLWIPNTLTLVCKTVFGMTFYYTKFTSQWATQDIQTLGEGIFQTIRTENLTGQRTHSHLCTWV